MHLNFIEPTPHFCTDKFTTLFSIQTVCLRIHRSCWIPFDTIIKCIRRCFGTEHFTLFLHLIQKKKVIESPVCNGRGYISNNDKQSVNISTSVLRRIFSVISSHFMKHLNRNEINLF